MSAMQLTHIEAQHAIEQLAPALRQETLGGRVIARHTRRRSQPDMALLVGREAHDPVVTQASLQTVFLLKGVMVLQGSRLRVIDAETAREHRDIEATLVVAGHVVEAVALEGDLQLRTAGLRVIGIQAVVGTYPVAVLTIVEDELYRFWRLRVSHHAPIVIEAIDAHALHRAPDDAVVAFAHRTDGAAQADALVLETPVAELNGTLGEHEQALQMAAQPEVATTVEHQGADLRRALIDAQSAGLHTLQLVVSQAIEAIASRTYI